MLLGARTVSLVGWLGGVVSWEALQVLPAPPMVYSFSPQEPPGLFWAPQPLPPMGQEASSPKLLAPDGQEADSPHFRNRQAWPKQQVADGGASLEGSWGENGASSPWLTVHVFSAQALWAHPVSSPGRDPRPTCWPSCHHRQWREEAKDAKEGN